MARPMKTTVPARRIGASLLLTALLSASGGFARPVPAAAASPVDAARAHLAGTEGGAAADWELVYERDLTAPDGAAMWVGKLVNVVTAPENAERVASLAEELDRLRSE